MIMYMTTKKQQSRKNKSRSNKKQKQQKKQKFFIGGTCAMCGSCMNQNNLSPLFRGGKNCTWKRRRGGNDTPPSFNGSLPQRYYYGLNTHEHDPNNPNAKIDARQIPSIRGGKTRTRKTTKRGGELGFSYFNAQMGTPSAFNPLNTVGDIVTSQIGSNYISGEVNSTVLPNPSVFSQPVETKYNMYNMPMA
jgi:hypothetical protein